MPTPSVSPLSHITPPRFTDAPAMPSSARNATVGVWACAILASLVAIVAWASTFVAPVSDSWMSMPGGIWAAVLSTIVAVTLKAIAMGIKRGSGWARRLGTDFCWIAIAAVLTGAIIENQWTIALAGICPIVLLLFLLNKATRSWCEGLHVISSTPEDEPAPAKKRSDRFTDEREETPEPAQI